jgi:hypothetical protein
MPPLPPLDQMVPHDQRPLLRQGCTGSMPLKSVLGHARWIPQKTGCANVSGPW